MKTINKKELRSSVQDALNQIIGNYQIESPSKKTTRLIEKASKKLSRELKDELKKQSKKMQKAGKKLAKQKEFVAA